MLEQGITDALRENPPDQVNMRRFAGDVLGGINVNDPDMSNVQRWLNERPHFVIQREKIAQASARLQKSFFDVVTGKSETYRDWLTPVAA